MSTTELIHSVHSALEKYFSLEDMAKPPKKSTRMHIFKDLTMCRRMPKHYTTRWQLS